MSLEQKKKEEEFQQNYIPRHQFYYSPQIQYFWESKAILLSQILNFRLNLPRIDERNCHSEYVIDQARKFQIVKWQDVAPKEELYEMSLTGHLIKAIKYENGNATLASLIMITEPFLPYLRKLNGKNFTGDTVRTVKGCLSAVVFKRTCDGWSVDETKVDEFITQANIKLAGFLEKIRKSFPDFEELRRIGGHKKSKKKQLKVDQIKTDQIFMPTYYEEYKQNHQPHQQFPINADSNVSRQQQSVSVKYEQEADGDYNLEDRVKIESSLQGIDNIKHEDINLDPYWFLQINELIHSNLKSIKNGQKVDDRFLGILIAFKNLKNVLVRLPECQRLFD